MPIDPQDTLTQAANVVREMERADYDPRRTDHYYTYFGALKDWMDLGGEIPHPKDEIERRILDDIAACTEE